MELKKILVAQKIFLVARATKKSGIKNHFSLFFSKNRFYKKNQKWLLSHQETQYRKPKRQNPHPSFQADSSFSFGSIFISQSYTISAVKAKRKPRNNLTKSLGLPSSLPHSQNILNKFKKLKFERYN